MVEYPVMKPIFIAIGGLVAFSGLFFIKYDLDYRRNVVLPATPIVESKDVFTPPTPPIETVEIVQEIIIPETPGPLPQQVLHSVPFVAQAPFGNWADAEQNYGCEEASLLMALYWAWDKTLTPEIALREIKAMSKYEKERYGDFHDTSVADTLDLLKTYLGHENAFSKYDIGIEDIKKELAAGNLVIVPIDGTAVNNIYYTPPGPFLHQIVIIGYDDNAQEFISHDPGTQKGSNYRYSYQTLESALMDYPTGFNEPVEEIRSAMIVVGK